MKSCWSIICDFGQAQRNVSFGVTKGVMWKDGCDVQKNGQYLRSMSKSLGSKGLMWTGGLWQRRINK